MVEVIKKRVIHKNISVALSIMLIFLIPLSSIEVVANWPMFQSDMKHTGYSPHNTNHIGGGLLWSLDLGDSLVSAPIISDDGTIYISSWREMYAVNPNGSIKWEFHAVPQHGQYFPVIDSSGNLYLTSSNGRIYLLNPDGTEAWNYSMGFGSSLRGVPTIGPNGNIYVGSYEGKLYSIYPNGTKEWGFQTDGTITTSPAISLDGTIYVGSKAVAYANNHVTFYAVNPDGTEKWSYLTDERLVATPSLGNGMVYFCADDHLYCFLPTGDLYWKYSGGVLNSLALGLDGTLYLSTGMSDIVAINLQGSEIWRTERLSEEWIRSSPGLSSDGTLFFISNDEVLHAIDIDGNKKWHFNPNNADNTSTGESSPAIGSNGTIYYGTSSGILYAVGGSDDPPQANFTAIPETGIISTVFWFNASNSSDNEDYPEVLSYSWDFGDGTSSDGIFVNHTYTSIGKYVVNLVVEDSTGKSDNITMNIVVSDEEISDYRWIIILMISITIISISIILYHKKCKSLPPPD